MGIIPCYSKIIKSLQINHKVPTNSSLSIQALGRNDDHLHCRKYAKIKNDVAKMIFGWILNFWRMLTYGQKTSQDVSLMTTWDETVLQVLGIATHQ